MWGGIVAALLLVVSTLVVGATVGQSGLTGAIFTTDFTGTVVNGNIYQDKCDVWLNGGPGAHAPPGAASLPDGTYYYQVTDPSGGALLAGPGAPIGTPDTSGKVITVSGGVFSLVQLCPYLDTPNNGGEYKVWVTGTVDFDATHTQGSFGFIPSLSKTDNFKVRASAPTPEPHPLLSINKFYDANTSGAFDPGEQLLSGWHVEVADPLGVEMTYYTPVTIPLSTSGLYTVSEAMPVGKWVQTALKVDAGYQNAGLPSTTPKSGSFQLNNQNHDVLFGNVCLGPAGGVGGKTIGYWSNKNGQAAMNNMAGGMGGALAFLSGLNLKDAQGNDFDPATYDAFKSWLLSANATNMAYMLSAQLAAMELDVRAGYVAGASTVWTGSTFITVNDLMTAANSALGADGLTLAGDPNRSIQEYLKNALDAANNNTNFVQAQPCPIAY